MPGMVIYEITTDVDAGLVDHYEQFMRLQHIPDLMATGCFQGAAFTRSAPGRYRIRYEAASEDDLARYLGEHGPRLREAFAARFPRGIEVVREVWTEIQRWSG